MKFPRKLNKIYNFQKNDKWYAADLDNQVLLEVNEIIIVILDLCENHNNLSIISKLRETYTSEALRSAFKQLEDFSELGFLFTPEVSGISDKRVKNPPSKIFVPFREYASVFTQFANALLLEELSKLCQVIVQIPEDRSRKDVQFGNEADIEYVTFSERDTLHWMLQIPQDSGILLLNSRTDTDSLLYQHLDFPIVQYLRSAELVSKTSLNNVLKSYNLMMPKDRLIVDSIWLSIFLEKHGICPEHLDFVPPGLSLNISPEKGKKKEARTMVNSLLPKRHETPTKIILMNSPFSISRIWEFAHKVSYLVPGSKILVAAPFNRVSYSEKVSVIPIDAIEDLRLLSLILQACDMSITIGWPGADASILVESLLANIASILIVEKNNQGVVERLEPRPSVVELTTLDNQSLLSHATLIADQVNRLLKEETVPTFARCPQNWEKCASDIYGLFEPNEEVRLMPPRSSWYGPTVFSMSFNPHKKSLSPRVYELPNLNTVSSTEGLTKILKDWHTDREVKLVLNSIGKMGDNEQ